MKSKKLFKVKQKLIKVLVTVICIITVFFSMPMKSNASILQSIASFILIIPDGVNMLLNKYISDETENVDFSMRISLTGEGSNDSGTLYNIEVTPYEIFTAGTLTEYGKYKEEIDEINGNGSEVKEALENGSAADAVSAARDSIEAQNNVEDTDESTFTTKSITKMPILDANFFRKTTGQSNNSADILRPIVSNVYNNLRNIVLVIMLIILLYIGIRIIISSAVSDQVKYKQYLINWVVGICLIFLMQYIMSAMMNVNQLVIDMISSKSDSEEYLIAFGPIDNTVAAVLNDCATPFEAASNPFKKAENSKYTIVRLWGKTMDIETKYLPISPTSWVRWGAGAISKGLKGTAMIANSFTDGWQQKKKKAEKDVGVANFINRKLLIYGDDTVGGDSTWEFDTNNHSIKDLIYTRTKKPTNVNAAIYNKENLTSASNRMRALYYCNIAEYCRTITTFSSKYTHIYNGNKSYTMTDKDDDDISDENDTEDENDYSSSAFWGYAFLYVLITIETVVFLYKYMKRVLWLAFLTMISPLIAVMYAVDKLGDGKAQTFNMWFKEYLFNTLIQPLHLLLYTIFLGAGMALMQANVIYGVVAYAFMIPAEKFFKKMFGFDKASTPGGLGSPAAGMMAMRGFDKLGGFGPHGKGSGGKSGGNDKGNSKVKFARNKLQTPNGIPGSDGVPGSSGVLGSRGSVNPIGKSPKNGGINNGTINLSGKTPGADGKNMMGRLKRGASNTGKRISSMGNVLGSRVARKITGGKTSDLGKAFFSKKGLAAMAANGSKFVGRNALRLAGGAGGAIVGTGLGLVAGGLASALTGEDQLLKGASAGAAAGGNRGMKNADALRGMYADLNETSKDWLASEDSEYAGQRVAQQIFEDNEWMTDDDRSRVEALYENGASKEDIEANLDKLMKSDETDMRALAFQAHLNNKYDLDDPEDMEKAISKYSSNFSGLSNDKLGITEDDILNESIKIENKARTEIDNLRAKQNKNNLPDANAALESQIKQKRKNLKNRDLMAEAEANLRAQKQKNLTAQMINNNKL